MEVTIDELLAGKGTRIKNNEYFPTRGYVEPFLERMSKFTDDFRVQVKLPDQITLTQDGNVNTDDVTYNRVWVQAVLPNEYCWDNHQQSVSLMYALDTRKPVVKLFSNALNMACLNLCVFQPNSLHVSELNPEEAINFRPLKNIMEATNDIRATLEKLSNMEFTKDDIFSNLGHWVDNCITAKYNNGFGTVKLPESLPIEAYKDVFYDEKSPYYVPDGITDGFNIYNAFTDIISNDKGKDIVNKYEKILLVKDIMGI